MEAKAYRNPAHPTDVIPEAPLQKYRELARQVELQYLHGKKLFGRATSPDLEIDKLTQDWTTADREHFRYWFRNTRGAGGLATAESKMETRTAQYMPHQNQQTLEEFKTKRRSIIRRLRRLQNELMDIFQATQKAVDWTDENYSTPDKKVSAIQNAINQICNLLGTLRTKEVTAAALTRTIAHLKKIDEDTAKQVTSVLNEQGGVVKVAAQGPAYEIAKMLKEELDTLNYGNHLRRFFRIYESLHKVGLSGIAQDVEEIIQKDLSSLTGITKKLGEVYSDLLKIPANEDKDEVKPVGAEEFKTPETVNKQTP